MNDRDKRPNPMSSEAQVTNVVENSAKIAIANVENDE